MLVIRPYGRNRVWIENQTTLHFSIHYIKLLRNRFECQIKFDVECMSWAHVFEFFQRFLQWKTRHQRWQSIKSSSATLTKENIDKTIRKDRQLSIRTVAWIINIIRESVCRTFYGKVIYEKKCVKIFPRNWTLTRNLNRKGIGSDTLKITKDDSFF